MKVQPECESAAEMSTVVKVRRDALIVLVETQAVSVPVLIL